MVIASLIVGALAGGAVVGFLVLLLARPSSRVAEVAAARAERDALANELERLRRASTDTAARLSEAERARAVAEERARRSGELETRLADREAQLAQARANASSAEARLLAMEEARRRDRDELGAWLAQSQAHLREAFAAASQDATSRSAEALLHLAQERLSALQQQALGELDKRQLAMAGLVNPLEETLRRMHAQVSELESARQQALGAVGQQLQSLAATHADLRRETRQLVEALRTPRLRGAWGEVQLRRVVELAGMVEHADFETQVHVRTETGALRPDLVVSLPGGRRIVVDAKVPLQAYLEALEAPDDAARAERLAAHAAQLRAHVNALAHKRYWEQFETSPEFVVLFVPGESYLGAALEADRTLSEDALAAGVLVASPTLLVALLKSAAYGWRQEKLLENTRQVQLLAQELYDRAATLLGPFAHLGERLGRAVEAYNQTVGSLESRLLVTARRFKELGAATGEEIPDPEPVDREVRALRPVVAS